MSQEQPDNIDRRSFLARGAAAGAGLAAVGGLGGLLAACSSSSSGSGGGGGGGTGTQGRNGVSSATPKRGGHLIFANEAEDNSLDPAVAQWDESGLNYARAIYDPLAVLSADGSVKPYLAQSITPNADYTVWTIKARPGVQFHDGSTCDGPAIAQSMNHFLSGSLGSVVKGPIQSITAPDAQTVTVQLKSPWVPFDYYLAGGVGGQIAYIVSPSFIAKAQAAGTNTAVTPIGTGPFKFQEWVPNDHLTAVRNPNYWRKGLPYLDQITFKPISDPNQRANSLQAGTVDMLHIDVPAIILQYRDNQNYGYIDDSKQTIGEPDMDLLLLNLAKPPFDDIRARQALACALNLDAFKAVINKGLNPVSNQPFSPGSSFYTSVDYPKYNPTQAKALVQQYTRDKGPLRFELGSTTSPIAVQANQFMQQQFQAAGMQVTLTQVQQDEFISDALGGKHQAYNWRQFGAVDPDLNYIFWSPTTIFPAPINLAVNMARNTDPQMETLLQQGRTTSDKAERAKVYQKVAQQFGKDIPYIWLDRAIWSVIAASKVQNFNNPTLPDGGKAFGMQVGVISPAEIWVTG